MSPVLMARSCLVPCMQCPFAHPGEKAKRRCPKRYRYSGTACPEFRRVSTEAGLLTLLLLGQWQASKSADLLVARHGTERSLHVGVLVAFFCLQNGCCRRQDACPFAHGVFECWLHPSRYRTQVLPGKTCHRYIQCSNILTCYQHMHQQHRSQ